ncbi:hypothetical protein [Alteromonas stellipolaris]|uniref:hypothetical protein n=1 Tax=Alteromonas stellipolaris TaxID=233316 RepID=UPI001D240651|nr:hypothetical protein [Alteromonas stellipolaris]MBZ2164275.1 hypothetical protein [Alteromonas stellipolaris]
MKLIYLSLFVSSLLISFQTKADDIYLFCDDCVTDSDFKSIAEDNSPQSGMWTLIVFNVNTSTAKAFRSEFLDTGGFDGGEMMLWSMTTPERATNALDYYNAILDGEITSIYSDQSVDYTSQASSLTNTVAFSTSTVSSGNGCGTDQNTQYIPDQPFLSACNAHDACYASSSTKAACDNSFLNDMIDIIDSTVSLTDIGQALIDFDISESLAKAMTRKLLLDMAAAYHWAVTNTEAAVTAYCNATTNTTSGECENGGGKSEYDGTITTEYDRDDYQLQWTCNSYVYYIGVNGQFYAYKDCYYVLRP